MTGLTRPAARELRELFLASLAITAGLFLYLAWRRAGVPDPHALGIFRYLILTQDFYVAPLFAAALCVALAPPLRRAGLRCAVWCARHPRWLAAATFLVLAAGARLVYHAHPLAMDEYAPLFQSEAFAAARLTGQLPPALVDWLVPKGFQGVFFKVSHESGAVASMYWPGLALLLTPFTALGVPWLLNPLLGGATVLAMHRLAREFFSGEESVGLVVLLTLASPAITINAISFYSMPAHLLANVLFVILLLRRTPATALAAGAVGSLALVLHNPVPHLLFGLPWIAWLAAQPGGWRLVVALGAGYLPGALLLGLGWPMFLQGIGDATAGASLTTPATAVRTFSQSLGSFRLPSATVFEARFLGLVKLWFWAAPALVAAAALGAWRKRDDTGAWLALAGCALLTLVGYLAVRFDGGHGWGYRYFHAAWMALPVFAVLAALPRERPAAEPGALAGFLAACALASFPITGVRALQTEHFIGEHLAQRPAAASGEPRVLIVDPASGFYAVDLVQNDPFLRNPVITLLTRGREADERMMARSFPKYRLLAREPRGSVWGLPSPSLTPGRGAGPWRAGKS